MCFLVFIFCKIDKTGIWFYLIVPAKKRSYIKRKLSFHTLDGGVTNIFPRAYAARFCNLLYLILKIGIKIGKGRIEGAVRKVYSPFVGFAFLGVQIGVAQTGYHHLRSFPQVL